jgi:hypothetical protein
MQLVNTLTQKKAASYSTTVGEDIGAAEGLKMMQRYQQQNPGATTGHFIGREIIEQILAQPGCVGIKTYYAINHLEQQQLVMAGSDAQGNTILEYKQVNASGQLEKHKGIVADRNGVLETEMEEWLEWLTNGGWGW